MMELFFEEVYEGMTLVNIKTLCIMSKKWEAVLSVSAFHPGFWIIKRRGAGLTVTWKKSKWQFYFFSVADQYKDISSLFSGSPSNDNSAIHFYS